MKKSASNALGPHNLPAAVVGYAPIVVEFDAPHQQLKKVASSNGQRFVYQQIMRITLFEYFIFIFS